MVAFIFVRALDNKQALLTCQYDSFSLSSQLLSLAATKEVQNYMQRFGEEEEDTDSFSSKTVVLLSVLNLDMLSIEKKRYRESAHQKILA